jgi:hypothetical protein
MSGPVPGKPAYAPLFKIAKYDHPFAEKGEEEAAAAPAAAAIGGGRRRRRRRRRRR